VPAYTTRRSGGKTMKVLTVLLFVALIATVGALLQTRSRLADATAETTPSSAPTASAARDAGSSGSASGDASGGAAPAEGPRAGAAGAVADGEWGKVGVDAPSPSAAWAGQGYTAAYVVERASGRVLFEHNAHTPVPTASMAKMMTALIVMEEIDAGRLKLDDQVSISGRASQMGGSQIYAKEGQSFDVKTLLAALMVQSGNDAAMALAEKVAGSGEAFADLMNKRAQQMGLEGSKFYDPHGLPNPEIGENMMTARDLALLGNELMKYPLMQEFAADKTYPFTNGTFTAGMTNPNHLLNEFDGAYGIKTGYTGNAGFSVTAAAKRAGMDVIAVVTGAATSRGPMSSFALAGRLLNDAFMTWTASVPVKEGQHAGEVKVAGGAPGKVEAVASRDAAALVPRGEDARIQWSFEPSAVQAPLAKGAVVGNIVLKDGNEVVGKVPAVAAAAVEKRPWWKVWAGVL
jgi:serine-type D-Ala-D-Ala carboxypeptidase (penicillin-binding protein 5/6)